MKRLDWYIIRKYFATFLFITAILMLLTVVFDFTEKMKDFTQEDIPLIEILQYYGTFIPHMFYILAPFFLFISVIWFTSKLASNTEIVSILGNGISYYRFLQPYIVSALLLTGIFWYANNYVIPFTNKHRVNFLNQYIHFVASNEVGITRTVEKTQDSETIAFIQNFSFATMEGYHFSLEKFENNEMIYQLRSPRIRWKEQEQLQKASRSKVWKAFVSVMLKRISGSNVVYPIRGSGLRSQEAKPYWEITSYEIWKPGESGSNAYVTGQQMDTTLGFRPDQFVRRLELKETMTRPEIREFIAEERKGGSKKVVFFQIEHHSRTANAFAVIVLTLIGVSFSSAKRRGGLGLNIVVGVALSGLFILFLRFSTTFATNANLPAVIAVWIPNIIFGVIAYFSVRWAPK